MTAPDLLPCPFCGGEAAYDFHAKGNPGAWENDCDHWVYCEADDCFANVGLCESKAEAIAAWNRRATPAPAAMRPEVPTEAVNRLKSYLARREQDRGASQDVLHCYDYHPDWGGIELRASDLVAVLAALCAVGDA